MRSERKARISGLAGTDNARNRTLPDLTFPVTEWDLGTRLETTYNHLKQPKTIYNNLKKFNNHLKNIHSQTIEHKLKSNMSVMTICHVYETREQVPLYSQPWVQVTKLRARFFGKIYALVSVNPCLSKAWD